jgi:hypothetical protein
VKAGCLLIHAEASLSLSPSHRRCVGSRRKPGATSYTRKRLSLSLSLSFYLSLIIGACGAALEGRKISASSYMRKRLSVPLLLSLSLIKGALGAWCGHVAALEVRVKRWRLLNRGQEIDSLGPPHTSKRSVPLSCYIFYYSFLLSLSLFLSKERPQPRGLQS